MIRTYSYYKDVFKDVEMPFAYVDMDLLDLNIKKILERAGNKEVRIASSAIRCTHLLRYILDSSPQITGIASFSVQEAIFLSENGFENLWVSYPAFQEADLESVVEEASEGRDIILTVDDVRQLKQIQDLAEQAELVLSVCIDTDMSTDFPGLHFGVYRSGVNLADGVRSLIREIEYMPNVDLVGLGSFEAQVAGVADNFPGRPLKNAVTRWLKKRSVRVIRRKRAAIQEVLDETNKNLLFFNGGGTGSLESTCVDPNVTEVTVGGGFLSPGLYDYFNDFRHEPAAAYALEVVRQPQAGIYTCNGGGYISAGPPGHEKIPLPYLPEGCKLTPMEGAGETQTPVIYKGSELLNLGSPVFFRPGKSREFFEHFNWLLLVRDGKIVEDVATYRGEGRCFL